MSTSTPGYLVFCFYTEEYVILNGNSFGNKFTHFKDSKFHPCENWVKYYNVAVEFDHYNVIMSPWWDGPG